MPSNVMNMSVSDKLRAQYVKRWSTVHLTHQQSLADHSFNVAMVALDLMSSVYGNWDNALAGKILVHALFHDLDEVITGDIPTETKARIKAAGPEVAKILDSFPESEDLLSRDISDLVKIADLIEGTFHVVQHCNGVHAEQVARHCKTVMTFRINNLDNKILSAAAWGVWHKLTTDQRTW